MTVPCNCDDYKDVHVKIDLVIKTIIITSLEQLMVPNVMAGDRKAKNGLYLKQLSMQCSSFTIGASRQRGCPQIANEEQNSVDRKLEKSGAEELVT